MAWSFCTVCRTRIPSGQSRCSKHRTRSPSSRNAMSSRWVRETRPAALERAGHRCEHCGAVDQLEVHHRDMDPSNNVAENLIVLCDSCHAEVHRQRSAQWQTA